MGMVCPECGGRKLRISHLRGIIERFGSIFGIYPIKCAECHARFSHRIWNLSHILFSKCPRCHRMDLSKWSDTHYRAPFSHRLKILFGGRRMRCVYCRHNFVSWRPLKEPFDAQKRIERSPIRIQVSHPQETHTHSDRECNKNA